MARRNVEQQFQIQVARYLSLALRPPTIWTAFPAGGGGKVRGALLKAMGLKAGWPDVIVMHGFRTRTTVLLGIELKVGKGRQSPEQKAVMAAFQAAGALYKVCRSLDDVEWALMDAGLPVFASASPRSTSQQERAA